jgi:hypothetical protein
MPGYAVGALAALGNRLSRHAGTTSEIRRLLDLTMALIPVYLSGKAIIITLQRGRGR